MGVPCARNGMARWIWTTTGALYPDVMFALEWLETWNGRGCRAGLYRVEEEAVAVRSGSPEGAARLGDGWLARRCFPRCHCSHVSVQTKHRGVHIRFVWKK
uniref:Uncharacterized protein n=1 Tax=Triticum urartu TaxID=4572 RepID=A0A8R7R665_TRIUA